MSPAPDSASADAGTLWPESLRDRVALFAGKTLDRLYGRGTDAHLPALERSQWWNGDELEAYQRERLEALLLHCWDHIPFYRRRLQDAGVRREEIEAGERVLERLPPLSRPELQAAQEELRAPDTGRTIVSTTSGSSGRPVTVAQDLGTAAWTRAVQRRAFRWYGVEPYERRTMILSAPSAGAKALRHRLVDLATGRRLFEFHRLDPQALESLATHLERYRPAFVTAYPSVLHELCLHCEATGRSLAESGPRLLHSQSEMLLETHRQSFRRVFGPLPILDEYGCVEVGGMAYTCPEGGRHISHEHVLLEVVDETGKPVVEGTGGRILLTPLEARAMPLLRYEVGDAGALSRQPCPCGRTQGAALLGRLEGRTFERLLSADGRAINAGIVHFIVRTSGIAPALQHYLAVQRQPGKVEFLLVPGETYRAEAAERLRATAAQVLGPGFEVKSQTVDEIPAGSGKKRSYFRSELAADLPEVGSPQAESREKP